MSKEFVKGYKVFNPDWTCKGKQYTCPGKFEEDVEISVLSTIHTRKIAWKLKKSALTAGSSILTIWKKIEGEKYDTRKFI